jgi:hypothetical protein
LAAANTSSATRGSTTPWLSVGAGLQWSFLQVEQGLTAVDRHLLDGTRQGAGQVLDLADLLAPAAAGGNDLVVAWRGRQ